MNAIALHNITNTIAKGFNEKQPPARAVLGSLDMSKAFDTVNIHTLSNKLLNTSVSNSIIKFVSNYISGRKAYTLYNGFKSRQKF